MEHDVNEEARQQNPFYPFAGKSEWELARFLSQSSLSQGDIDDFLKLSWVRTNFVRLIDLLMCKLNSGEREGAFI